LAGEVADRLQSGRAKKWRCPAELRLRIMSYARVCGERCEPLDDIARRLGLVESTLARRLRAVRRSLAAEFRSVSIVPATDESETSSEAHFRLVTPRGYRIEGLDAPTLAFLLKVVG